MDRQRKDRGQAVLEYVGFIPILLLVALCGIQLGWAAYVVQQAQTAARTAARVEARKPGEGAEAGKLAIKESLRAATQIQITPGDAITATVTIPIKSIVPGVDDRTVTRSATMPNDDPDPKGP
ncbi:TadE/TadG family type IV pilus assembly protein [Streptomyces sp. NPDC059989]|uniref:TadE/TadG family type IV pilus assembly protein n=1 Tax=Streptomyces sp. NPDC059989 TaxID=3347026 RepID=UPI0036A7FBF5